ncbi:hypothetical protein GIB67_014969, partial [Kingdonia uniflora]
MGIDDVSRTINVQSGFGFCTYLRSTFTIPRETSTQEDYHVSNRGPMHFGVDDVSRTVNRQTGTTYHTYSSNTLAIPRQTGSGFCVNPHSTLAIPRKTSTQGDYQLSEGGSMHMGTDDGSRSINAETCSALHTNQRSTITILIPRKTSTKANCHVSNGNSMHQVNAKTGIESDSQTSAVPQLEKEIFNVPIKDQYAQSNGVARNELPMILTSISLAGLFGIYAVVCCISFVTIFLKMARGGRGRGRVRTRGGIREGVRQGMHSSVGTDKQVVNQESSGFAPIPQAEPVVSEVGVGVGVAPGVQIHQSAPPSSVILGHPGVLPVPAASATTKAGSSGPAVFSDAVSGSTRQTVGSRSSGSAETATSSTPAGSGSGPRLGQSVYSGG